MNLYKITLSLLITAAPASARLSSDEKDSSAVMRELIAKVDAIQADNEALKSKVASLEKRRGLMPDLDLDGIDLPDMSDMDVKDLTDLLGVEVDPSSGGGPLYGLLSGIISSLLGVKKCVGFGFGGFDRRRLSGERRLEGGDPTCFFGGGPNVDVFIGGDFIELDAWEIDLDAFAIGDWSIERGTFAEDLIVDIENHDFASQSATTNTTEAWKEKKAEFQAKVASMKEP